ncbi:hypothetical protein CLV46_1799 [Diaminobutyricimonas aerilata]|uniref:Uncharacterized protein n=1 Tax=Diaminobutyricimonas aerilata TaxID=1162967 RepID=A0A2M9CK15_9MICO|nr:hypothetical protein [Diaminobutyricimonas aerilata]PJJ72234.1 hypothetical protein CLV46_1799 [Diaminobutyricimonas aerilata]
MSERRRPAPPFNPQALVETVPRRVITERMLAHARVNAEETIDRDVLRALRASAGASGHPTPEAPTTPGVEGTAAGPVPAADAARGGPFTRVWRATVRVFTRAGHAVGRVARAPFARS